MSFIRLRVTVCAALSALCAIGWHTASHAVIPASERTALIDLYNSTNGASWSNNGGWNGAVGTECSWYGVSCSASDANVIELRLGEVFTGNNLAGPLPASLNQLTRLRYAAFDDNEITGSVPSLAGLTLLEYFSISGNALDGTVPPLTGLTALREFNVANNQLDGPLPSLAGLTALQYFYAYGNRFTGLIPSLSGLSQLIAFQVYENRLTGSIPSLSGLSNLINFSANNNRLTGALPSLAGLNALIRFRVENNQLTGAIPSLTGISLLPNQSGLCPNQLTVSVDAAWDAATGSTPWSTGCTAALIEQTLTFGPPPLLTPGSRAAVTVTVSPLPGSRFSIIYRSFTPNVCDADGIGPGITALPNAPVGSVCIIAADKPGDENTNTAPQVQQSIVIAAPAAVVATSVPMFGLFGLIALALSIVSISALSYRRSISQVRDEALHK